MPDPVVAEVAVTPPPTVGLDDLYADEYGQWRATQPILFDGAVAYGVGHPVPASNVKAHNYDKDGLVERVPNTSKKKG